MLTGATLEKIEAALISHEGFEKSGIELIKEKDFTLAVKKRAESAVSGDCVLLSPACASFDAFMNFEERGEYFKNIVNEL